MNAVDQILSTIKQVLGFTNNIRSTANSVTRETKNVSNYVKSRKEKKEAEKASKPE